MNKRVKIDKATCSTIYLFVMIGAAYAQAANVEKTKPCAGEELTLTKNSAIQQKSTDVVRSGDSKRQEPLCDNKTPSSLLGIEFGKSIEEVTGASGSFKIDGGSALCAHKDPSKSFRKFTRDRQMDVYASITTHTVFCFKWVSEEFTRDTKEEDAVKEVLTTCEVMAKKFGDSFREVKIKESDKWTIWDRKYVAVWGDLRVELFLECRRITMTASNVSLEAKAKKEVKVIQDSQGDGADAL